MTTLNQEERRKFKRYEITEDVYIAFRPELVLIGKLRDICIGGVGLECALYENQSIARDVEVDIFSGSTSMHLAEVPCKVAYDVTVEDFSFLGVFEVHRCGLEFKALSSTTIAEMIASLGYELDDHQ